MSKVVCVYPNSQRAEGSEVYIPAERIDSLSVRSEMSGQTTVVDTYEPDVFHVVVSANGRDYFYASVDDAETAKKEVESLITKKTGILAYQPPVVAEDGEDEEDDTKDEETPDEG